MSKRFMYLVAGVGIGWFAKSAYTKVKEPTTMPAGTQQVVGGKESFLKATGEHVPEMLPMLGAMVAAPFIIDAIKGK